MSLPKKSSLLLIIAFFFLSGCTQMVTTPIKVAGAAVETTIEVTGDVARTTYDVVTGEDEDEVYYEE